MPDDHDDSTDFDTAEVAALLERTQFEIKRVLVGQDRMIGHGYGAGLPDRIAVARTLARLLAP